jgi:hypothetical protein
MNVFENVRTTMTIAGDGQPPDVEFSADKAVWSKAAARHLTGKAAPRAIATTGSGR